MAFPVGLDEGGGVVAVKGSDQLEGRVVVTESGVADHGFLLFHQVGPDDFAIGDGLLLIHDDLVSLALHVGFPLLFLLGALAFLLIAVVVGHLDVFGIAEGLDHLLDERIGVTLLAEAVEGCRHQHKADQDVEILFHRCRSE